MRKILMVMSAAALLAGKSMAEEPSVWTSRLANLDQLQRAGAAWGDIVGARSAVVAFPCSLIGGTIPTPVCGEP